MNTIKLKMAILLAGLSITFLNSTYATEKILKDYLNDPAYKDDHWQTSTPKAQGLNPAKLSKALDFIAKKDYEIHSFSIIKNGKLVFDHYGIDKREEKSVQRTPDDMHILFSTTKTFTSALLGIAINEKKISGVKDRVLDYYDEQALKNVDANKKAMTLEDLLTMRSGMLFEGSDNDLFNNDQSNNPELVFLNRPLKHKPGTHWNYNSANSHTLTKIIHKVTGKTPISYAQEKIFQPLGIKNVKWRADNSGTNYGNSELFLTPRDLARFGYMYIHKGLWKNKQVVPQSWIDISTKSHSKTPWVIGDYGYHTWAPKIGGFCTTGYKGQNMFMFPEHDLVVIFTANLDYRNADEWLMEIVDEFVLPSIIK